MKKEPTLFLPQWLLTHHASRYMRTIAIKIPF